MKCAKTAEPIEMQLKMLSQVPRNRVGVQITPWEGHFLGCLADRKALQNIGVLGDRL